MSDFKVFIKIDQTWNDAAVQDGVSCVLINFLPGNIHTENEKT